MTEKFIYPILNAEEQYENLVSKGLIMDRKKEEILFFLTHHSYFKLMLYFRPYWCLCDGQRIFQEGVTRSRILQDYCFDQDARILLFSYITYIENSFKNSLCQSTCQVLGNTRWEESSNFVDPQVFVDNIQPILSEILLGESKREHVQKYMDRYDDPKNPPFWNMLEVFTFGQVAKMYRYLTDHQIKKTIAKTYNMDDQKLSSRMKTIVDARNICCHHNKLFDKVNWKIARVNVIETMLDKRHDTFYHVCCLMQYLLQQIINENSFMQDIDQLLLQYQGVRTTFPDNWKDLWK